MDSSLNHSIRFLGRAILLALVICGEGRAAPAVAATPPNIVVVLVDDLRWDDIGCAGHPFVQTPNIDRIAREGARFTEAFATTPLCSPSRASFLTGLYPHRHGIIDNTERGPHSHKLKTFPQELQRVGYETAFIGKWHMGNDDTPRPGFEYWLGMKGQGTSYDPEFMENRQGIKVPGYVTDILNSRAVQFIRRPHARPFLLYLAHKAMHPELTQRADGSISDPTASRFVPAERHRDLYATQRLPRRPNVHDALDGKPALRRTPVNAPPPGPSSATDDEAIRGRLRMLAAVDEGVGEVYRALQSTGQLDRTVIVFTSDHGYFYGEHGLTVERRLAYEEAIRIPLLIRYPPLIRPRTVVNKLSLSIDLAPTLLEMAGANMLDSSHGRSLVPLLKRQPVKWRQSVLIEYFSDAVFPRIANMGYQALRTEAWKYIHYTELQGMDELYDLRSDPYEMRNLIHDPRMRSRRDELQAELRQVLRSMP